MEKVKQTIFINELKLMFFIALISVIILGFGYIITEMYGLGIEGIIFTALIAAGINIFTYYNSKSIVLKSQRAVPMRESDFPEYCSMVKEMCRKNNIIMPDLYYINSPALNAFATGRNEKDAAVVITSGLLKNAPLDEIKGVIGHELSHIIHKDIMISSFISIMLGFITIAAAVMRNASLTGERRRSENSGSLLLVIGIAASILAPIAAMLIQTAVSRSREYMADASGAVICGNPELLAKALYRISHEGSEMPEVNEASASMYISNPLKKSMFSDLFSTHPDINDRIKRLQEMKMQQM